MFERAAKHVITVLLGLTLLQVLIVLFTPLSLSTDEAHYWEWSKRLDYSYYSKGPLIAYLIAVSTAVFGDTAFAVRFPGIVCALFTSLALYYLLLELVDRTVAATSYLLFRTSLFFLLLTTHPPLILFWVLSLFCSYRAILRDDARYWLLFGVCAGAATLSKFTAAILPISVGACLLFTPSLRKHLRRPFTWLGVLLYLASLLPVVYWNQLNGWVTLAHNTKHVAPKTSFTLRYLGELLGAQFGLIGAILLPLLVVAARWGFKRARSGDVVVALWLWTSLPLSVVCLVLSFTKRVYANWPMPLYISLFLLLAMWIKQTGYRGPWLERAFLLNAFVGSLALIACFGVTFGLPGEILPTKKLVGWEALGHVAEAHFRREFAQGEPLASEAFVAVTNYHVGSAVAFYMTSHPTIFCDNHGTRRICGETGSGYEGRMPYWCSGMKKCPKCCGQNSNLSKG